MNSYDPDGWSFIGGTAFWADDDSGNGEYIGDRGVCFSVVVCFRLFLVLVCWLFLLRVPAREQLFKQTLETTYT